MKRIILVFGLVLTGLALFGQSPRIRLNQIVKDSLTGSVVLSGSDSNMVYSRDFFLNLTDSVLILFGDTLSTTATAFTGVATDLTLTGNGTVGTPLKVDTSVIATIKAISDSLAALSFASLQDITDTLNLNTRDYITGLRLTDTLNTNSRGFLTQNQTITLTDDATGTGTTSISVTVVNDSHNHTISTLTGIQDSLNSKAALIHTHTISDVAFLQDSLDAKANDADLNNYLLTANYIVDSTRINATGDTAYYYQNGVLIGTGAIAGGGGGGSGTVTSITAGTYLSGGTITTSGTIALDTASAGLKTYISDNKGTVNLASGVTGTLPVANGGTGATTLTSGAFLKGNGTSAVSGSSNLTETADTVFVSKFLNVDTATLYVDAVNNRVGIGTSSPSTPLEVYKSSGTVDTVAKFGGNNGYATFNNYGDLVGISLTTGVETFLTAAATTNTAGFGTITNSKISIYTNNTQRMTVDGSGNVGIGTTTPAYTLDVVGDINASGEVRNSGVILTSDSRYKKDINSIQNASYKLMELNPVSYYWNELMIEKLTNSQSKTKEQIKYGLVAQEVELNFPEFVSEGADGFKAIDYQAIISLLLKGWQEQQVVIQNQQQEINQLKTTNETLQTEINTIKSQLQLILTEINNLKNN